MQLSRAQAISQKRNERTDGRFVSSAVEEHGNYMDTR